VKSIKQQASKMVVVFENIESSYLAQTLVGKEVYREGKEHSKYHNATQKTLPNQYEEHKEHEEYEKYEGYKVFDDGKIIGTIAQFFDFNGNMCFEILPSDETNQNKFLIPAHPDFVVKIDKRKRQLWLRLPDGLICEPEIQ
jgi:ribosomal 30S subunit maturation factor RimM